MLTEFKNNLNLTDKEATDVLHTYGSRYIQTMRRYPNFNLQSLNTKLKADVYDILNQVVCATAVRIGRDGNYIINIPDKRLNKIARLITYGDLGFKGDRILMDAYASAFKHL
jgi:hypothetical protein